MNRRIEQVTKQLNKQIDVLKVSDITDKAIVARELALIKVLSTGQTRSEINGIVDPFRATIIDVARKCNRQVTGETSKIEAIVDLLRPYGIKEIARTGITAFARGNGKGVTDLKQYSIVK